MVNAGQKSKTKEIQEEKPEITASSTEIAVEESNFESVKIRRQDGQENGLNKASKAVDDEKSSGDSPTPVISLSNKGQTYTDHRLSSDVIIDEHQAGIESNHTVVNAEDNISVKNDIEEVNSSHSGKNYVEEDCRDEKVDESNGFDSTAVVENGLEEKPTVVQESKNEEQTVIEVMNEEKPAVSSSLNILSDNTKSEMVDKDFGNKLGPVVIDKDSDIISHDTSRIRDSVTKDNYDISAITDTLHEVTLNKDPDLSATTEIVELKRADQKTKVNCESTEKVEFDHSFEACNGKTEPSPPACVTEEEPVIKSKERPGLVKRTRAHSEQRSERESPPVSQDIASALRSGSLESLKLSRQQEDVAKGSRRSGPTYSPPANSRNPVGHLRREKTPARMLRNTSFDVVCNVFDLLFMYISMNCTSCSSLVVVCTEQFSTELS